MATYGSPARTHKVPVRDPKTKLWYTSAEAMAKGAASPRRDAQAKPTSKFLDLSALEMLRNVSA